MKRDLILALHYEDLDSDALEEEGYGEEEEIEFDSQAEEIAYAAHSYSRRLLDIRGTAVDVAFIDRATSLPSLVFAHYAHTLTKGDINMHDFVTALEGTRYEQ